MPWKKEKKVTVFSTVRGEFDGLSKGHSAFTPKKGQGRTAEKEQKGGEMSALQSWRGKRDGGGTNDPCGAERASFTKRTRTKNL